jgi:hypothetical protein
MLCFLRVGGGCQRRIRPIRESRLKHPQSRRRRRQADPARQPVLCCKPGTGQAVPNIYPTPPLLGRGGHKMWATGGGAPPLGSAHHHVDVAVPTPGTDQPIAPLEQGHLGAIPLGHLGRIRLHLVLARLAPDDEPHAGRGAAAECRGRARFEFHPRRRRFIAASAARGRSPGFDVGSGLAVTAGGGSILSRMPFRVRIRGDSG